MTLSVGQRGGGEHSQRGMWGAGGGGQQRRGGCLLYPVPPPPLLRILTLCCPPGIHPSILFMHALCYINPSLPLPVDVTS